MVKVVCSRRSSEEERKKLEALTNGASPPAEANGGAKPPNGGGASTSPTKAKSPKLLKDFLYTVVLLAGENEGALIQDVPATHLLLVLTRAQTFTLFC